MSDRSYTTIDKTGWGDGPWQEEPDKLQWIDEQTGLDCLIVRNRLGALCGYVGVPPEHSWHGRDYGDGGDDEEEDSPSALDVHGGLTFSARCDEDVPPQHAICHVPEPGRPDDIWWFGFDCGHFMDVQPAFEARERRMGLAPLRFGGETYKTVDYVRRQCAYLAAQLARIA